MKEITESSYNDELEGNKVLIDWYAPWCSPCKEMTPILEEISNEYKDIKILKVNIEENRQFAINNGIKSIPTLRLYKDKNLIKEQLGLCSKEEIIELINI